MFELKDELLHPALSHFPIALFVLALVTRLAIYLFKNEQTKGQIDLISKFLLYTSAPFYMITLFLGDMALDVVKNDLCNLVLALKHEQTAETGLIFIISSVLFQALIGIKELDKYSFSKVFPLLLLISLGIGNFYILKTSHQGGMMVYEQGAAVQNTKDCP